jgi:hypothetical protein
VHSLSPPKPAGLDPPPQIFAGILQIKHGTIKAKKKFEKKNHEKLSEIYFLECFFGKIFLADFFYKHFS